jgi:cytochrome c oxidase assembly protein subunit 15
MRVNFFRPKPNASFYLACFCTGLTFLVILLGAYTRLTDAGLGCPDWPGCYGQWMVNNPDLSALNLSKAWTEMIHRYIAGLLMLSIIALFFLNLYYRQKRYQPIVLPSVILLLVAFQAALGMWTVTLKLSPLVVIAHLLGGFITLSLLWWLALSLKPLKTSALPRKNYRSLQRYGLLSLAALLLQIFLGGLTSAHYAALVCLDFPFCAGNAAIDYQAFTTFPLTLSAIHMLHRLGALITSILLIIVSVKAFSQKYNRFIRNLSLVIIFLLSIQLALGITNVLALLPLSVAVSHNGCAALLLLAVVTLNYYLNHLPKFKFYGI